MSLMKLMTFTQRSTCATVTDRSDCSNIDRESLKRFERMQNPKLMRRLKLTAILLLAGVSCLTHTQMTVGAQDQPARLFEIAGMTMPFEQRVGVDDSAEFVVHFGGDTRGTLDACG